MAEAAPLCTCCRKGYGPKVKDKPHRATHALILGSTTIYYCEDVFDHAYAFNDYGRHVYVGRCKQHSHAADKDWPKIIASLAGRG